MTRKIKNSLLITLVGLLFTLTGIALFSSSQSKVNADETVAVRLIDMYDSSIEYGTVNVQKNSIDTNGDILAFMESREKAGYCLDIYRLYIGDDFSTESLESFDNHKFIDLSTFVFSKDETILVAYSTCYVFSFYSDSDTQIGYMNVYMFGYYSDIPTAPEKIGYIFKGWTLDLETNELVDLDELRYNEGNYNLYAVYEVKLQTVNVMHDGEVIKSYTVEQGSIITVATLKKDLARDGYDLVGLSYTADGVPAELSDITVTSDLTLYAVYEESETETIGDKISDFANNVSDWLTNNTGVAVSSGSLIVVAIILAVIMLTKRR